MRSLVEIWLQGQCCKRNLCTFKISVKSVNISRNDVNGAYIKMTRSSITIWIELASQSRTQPRVLPYQGQRTPVNVVF